MCLKKIVMKKILYAQITVIGHCAQCIFLTRLKYGYGTRYYPSSEYLVLGRDGNGNLISTDVRPLKKKR